MGFITNALLGTEQDGSPKYEPLRPLVRAALEKEEASQQDLEYLIRKAMGLGMEPEEFRLLWESMLAAKKRAGKKSLFRGPNYDHYFETELFNNDFDEIFLSAQERDKKMLDELNFVGKIFGEGNGLFDDMLSLFHKTKNSDL